MRDPKLIEMIDKALRAWPDLVYRGKRDSRAHAAADLVERGRVVHLHGDNYDVDGKRCCVDSDRCDCADWEHGAPVYPKVGRLCKHRLAARMYRAWGGEQNEQLLSFLQRFIGSAGATLIMEWDYESDRRSIVGLISGHRPQRWPGNKGIVFTWQQLRWALGQIGWGLTALPAKQRGYEYTLQLAPGRGIELNENTLHVKGVTASMVERQRNERLSEWMKQELSSPLAVPA